MSTPTQNGHTTTAQLFADHVLKDGSRAGSKQVGDFTKAFVDAVYAKLLVVESLDAEGNVVRRECRRMAIAAMGACRRAWFVMQRAEKAIVPADNPFAKMGLKKLAPGQKKTETPTATWDELMAFRMSAVKLGYASIATAALTAWPSSRQSSTPLDDVTRGAGLFALYREAHHRAAELRDELSFTSLRHGGFTEGADSDLSDAELRAAGRHRSARQLPTYAKRTRKQLIAGVQKRRAERTKPAGLSE